MKKIAIIITLSIVLLACKSYSVFTYDILNPAKFTIAPEVKSIVLVNNSYPFVNKDAHFVEVEGDIEVLDSIDIKSFTDSVLLSLKESLLEKEFFDTVYLDTTKYNTLLWGKKLKKLTAFEVNSVCSRYGADAILALDGYSYGSKIEVIDYGDGLGAAMDVNATTYWRFYDYNTQSILFEDVKQDTIFWYEEGISLAHAASRLPSIERAITDIAFYAGEEYVKRMVPQWETKEQRIYVAGNTYFVNAAEWYAKKNFEEAEKLWGYIYQHGKTIEQARAAFNIAVSFEQQNDVASALEWAFKSYKLYQTKKSSMHAEEVNVSKELYVYLAHRKNDVEKLDQQLGGAL